MARLENFVNLSFSKFAFKARLIVSESLQSCLFKKNQSQLCQLFNCLLYCKQFYQNNASLQISQCDLDLSIPQIAWTKTNKRSWKHIIWVIQNPSQTRSSIVSVIENYHTQLCWCQSYKKLRIKLKGFLQLNCFRVSFCL